MAINYPNAIQEVGNIIDTPGILANNVGRRMSFDNQKIAYYTDNVALAFSDVYLLPKYSDIKSRFGSQINTSAKIAKGTPDLKIPFVSAGMDTVSEDDMAIIMALNGGLGEIHRNNTPDVQAELVRRVKEKMRVIEKNPPKVSESATIGEVLSLLKKRNRGYVVVYPGDNFEGKISGLATDRDFYAGKKKTPISQVMTKLGQEGGKPLIVADEATTPESALEIMRKERIEKLPVVSGEGNLIGVYTLKDHENNLKYPNASKDEHGRLMVGAAIGVHEIDVERALKLVEVGVDVLFLDIAHGHSFYSEKMIKRLKVSEKIKTPIIVGNVATKKGALFAYEIGADGIKVGVGPGFVCKTRNVAGTGVPQITAVLEAKEALANKKNPPPIISDGGVREPGDPPKALAAGADCVMIGSILAGTDASPGDLIRINGILQKRVRGMASKGALEDRKKLGKSTTDIKTYSPEGREIFTSYQGSTQELLWEYIGGLRSAMSYSGSHSIEELQKTELIHISSSGASEQIRPLG